MSPRKSMPETNNKLQVSMSLSDMAWNKTGNWTFFAPVYADRIAPCAQACPLGVPIARYMHLLKKGEYREAWKLIVSANPLPAVTGRVCYHECEGGCNRKELDEALNIHGVERFLGDAAIDENWQLDPPAETVEGPPVAVLGSGPAGLGCAYALRMQGYPVIVYERENSPGGMLRVGVPQFRMPRRLLDAEIARLERIGVEFRCGRAVEDLAEISRLVRAVFLGSGAHGSRDPRVEGSVLEGVFFGLDFLKAYNCGQPPETGRKLAIIGGGNTAIDVARAGRRLGAEVDLYYRRTESEMPAHPEELAEARAEGARFNFQVAPLLLTSESGGRVTAVRFVRMRQGDLDESGRARPMPIEGSEFRAAADMVVFAVGEVPELDYLGPDGEKEGGRLAVDQLCRTSRPGVFAGGDIVPGENSVSHALADGIAAARNMGLLFKNPGYMVRIRPAQTPVDRGQLNLDYFSAAPRAEATPRLESEPVGSAEARSTLTPDQAAAEAGRCINCGTCVDCDNCLIFCPDMAIYCHNGGYMVKTDYCKGCGICAEECPRGVIAMERKK